MTDYDYLAPADAADRRDAERIRRAAQYRERFDPRQRFRPYRVTDDGDREWIAAAGCETELGIVPMLIQLHADGEYASSDHVGVLDTGPWRRGNPGRWVVNPYPERGGIY